MNKNDEYGTFTDEGLQKTVGTKMRPNKESAAELQEYLTVNSSVNASLDESDFDSDFDSDFQTNTTKKKNQTSTLRGIAKDLEHYLKKMSPGSRCGTWKYYGKTDIRYSNPGGGWSNDAFMFEKNDRKLNLAVEWLEENNPYIVIESVNRSAQTINYDFIKYSRIEKNTLLLEDNLSMTYGQWGRVPKEKLLDLYKQVKWDAPFVISDNQINRIDFSLLIDRLLTWGEKRDAAKEIIAKNPAEFFGKEQPSFGIPESGDEGIPENIAALGNKTKILTDSPGNFDLLNRRPFATYLALKFEKLWKELNDKETPKSGKSFVVHLYGEWGSGKTTFLNLLKNDLESLVINNHNFNWTVVNFNAWQNQHMSPAWWPLMDRIITDSLSRSANKWNLWNIKPKVKEKLRRFSRAWGFEFLLSILFFVIGVLLLTSLGDLKSIFEITKGIGGLVTVATSVYMLIRNVSKSLYLSSSQSAELYQKFTQDPLENIKNHFSAFLNDFNQPIIVFIDDLDRCREDYVVSLLESLHTLFNDQRVFYLVSADKKWISSCFHNSYKSIAENIENKDRPTGHMFIEKLFQISVSLPSISEESSRYYIATLLKDNALPVPRHEFTANTFESQISTIDNAENFGDITNIDTNDPAILNRIVLKSSVDTFEADLKHRLEDYVKFLSPNPRFIKLLINTFETNVMVAFFSGIVPKDDDYDHVAIWSIISLRFPSAAQELAEDPSRVRLFLSKPVSISFTPALESLRKNQDFTQLLEGKPSAKTELSPRIIKALTGQRP